MDKETIAIGANSGYTEKVIDALSAVGFNMNILSKFMDPTKSVTHEDIAAFKFGPGCRRSDETFEDYRSRRKAEGFMLTVRHKFGIKSNQTGTYIKVGGPSLSKKERKAQKRAMARSRKAMARSLNVKRIQPMSN